MKKVFFMTAIVLIPFFIFVNIFQNYRFYILEQEIAELEADQKEKFELNKEILSNIALYKSLDRLEKAAIEKYGLVKMPEENVVHVRLPEGDPQND